MPTKKPVAEVKMTPELNTLIGEWWTQAELAGKAVLKENELRLKVFNQFYKSDDPRLADPGTDHFQMPGGWVLKIERRINTKIEIALLDAVKQEVDALPIDEETGEKYALGGVIEYKPAFNDSKYAKLPEPVLKILNKALTRTPGTPGIKLELPKSVQAKATGEMEQPE